MKISNHCLTLFFTAITCLTGCKEKYDLPSTVVDKNYLVVEGFINSGPDSTFIQLSRTTNLSSPSIIQPETNATVSVMGSTGEHYLLSEKNPGLYGGGPFTLTNTNTYQLQINTSDGKQYISADLKTRTTPAIDSVSWQQDPGAGVRIFVNTHDASNQTRYYAWNFEETWEFLSYTTSGFSFVAEDSTVVPRAAIDSIYRCWQHNRSTAVLIGSSARLSNDVIYMAPLTSVEQDSWKLSTRYSILVKQRALDKETYEYLEKVKKNTEQLGSIFDPLPSTGSGNIRCVTNPGEPVIGQAYISNTVEQRIFILPGQLTRWRYRLFCELDTIPNIKDSLAFFFSAGMVPIDEIRGPLGGTVLGYSASSTYCMDCRLRGKHERPDFW